MAQITLKRKDLLSAMNHAYMAKMQASPSVYNCYLFERYGANGLMVTGSDSETTIQQIVRVSIEKNKQESDDLRFTILGNQINKALRLIDDDEITIVTYETQMSVRHSNGTFMVPFGWSAEQFLISPKEPVNYFNEITVEAPALKHWLDKVAFATADDELRPVMNGVCFDFQDGSLDIAASNGHILVRQSTDIAADISDNYIFPKKVINILRRVLSKTGFVKMQFDKDCVRLTITTSDDENEDPIALTFKPIDGRYPNYRSVIPQSSDYVVSFETRKLLRSLQRTDLFSNESSRMVRMKFNDNNSVELSSKNVDYETSASEVISISQEYSKNQSWKSDGVFGFRGTTLQSILKRIDTKEVVLCLQDPSRAIVIQQAVDSPNDGPADLTYIAMPMYISD